jgi:hypothetical protein
MPRAVVNCGIGIGETRFGGARHADQIVEKGAVVNHGAAQLFSAGLSARVPQGDVMSGAVVLDYDGVVDGDVCCALLKIANRIAAGCHNVAEEPIRFSDRSCGSIDEMGLNAAPLIGKAIPLSRGERANGELMDALTALGQTSFGLGSAACLCNGAIVLRTELCAQPLGATAMEDGPDDESDYDDSDNGDSRNDFVGGERGHIHAITPQQKVNVNKETQSTRT